MRRAAGTRARRQVGRMVGCSLALIAICAGLAPSALALPEGEFGRCKKVAAGTGKYKNSGCTLEAGALTEEHKYEWTPGVIKNKGTAKLKEGIPTLETEKGTKITCTGEENPGEITSNTTVGGVVAKFNGCKTAELPCHSAGAASGEIVTASLEGRIGTEKRTIVEGKEVAAKNKLALELHAPGGGDLADFECAGLPVRVIGSVLHPIKTGAMVSSAVEKFTATAAEQKPEKFAGGVKDEHILESNTGGGAFEEAGQTITATATYEEKIEANPIF